MEERIQKLEKEIEEIKQRNLRVENDKAWEISWARRIFITASTYVIAYIWLVAVVQDTFPLLKAFVPALGYLLSTLSLPFIKKWWIKNQNKE